MDPYIKARLERAESSLNHALNLSKGTAQAPGGAEAFPLPQLIQNNIKAAQFQFTKIEKYIHQCGTQAKEDSKYHSIIE